MKGKDTKKKSRVDEWDAREKELTRQSRIYNSSNNGDLPREREIDETVKGDRKLNPKRKFRITLFSFAIFLVSLMFLIWTMLEFSTVTLWLLGYINAIISGSIFCVGYAKYLAVWILNSLTQQSLK